MPAPGAVDLAGPRRRPSEVSVLASIGYAVAYTGVGIALLVLGFFVLDALTPGHLRKQIWQERSPNAAIVLAAGFLGQGAIAFTTIWTNATSGFGTALSWTVASGVPGAARQGGPFA